MEALKSTLTNIDSILTRIDFASSQPTGAAPDSDLKSLQAMHSVLLREKAERLADAVTASAELDGFTDRELCLHTLVAGPVDDAILCSALAPLSSSHALSLLSYLSKWLAKFAARGVTALPARSVLEPRTLLPVPALDRGVAWASACLDVHAAKLVFNDASLRVLEGMGREVAGQVRAAREAGALIGPLAHVACGGALPAVGERGAQSLVKVEVLQLA